MEGQIRRGRIWHFWGAPIFSPEVPKYLFLKGFWDLSTENRGAPKTPNSTTTDLTPHLRPSEMYRRHKWEAHCGTNGRRTAVQIGGVLRRFPFSKALKPARPSVTNGGRTSGQEKRAQRLTFWGPETSRWGGGFPREGVVAEKFVLSHESLSSLGFEERNLGYPGNFAGMSQTPDGAQKLCAKKNVYAHFSFPSTAVRIGGALPVLFRQLVFEKCLLAS